MAHTHARTEIGIGYAFWGSGLHEGPHDRIATRIPAGGCDRYGIVFFTDVVETIAETGYLCVYVETVDRMNTSCEYFFGKFFDLRVGVHNMATLIFFNSSMSETTE